MKLFNHRIKLLAAAVLVTITSLGMAAGPAMAQGVPWKDHQAPFDFLFGNHIDTHIQVKPGTDGGLSGFFYITFTGESTPDGTPIARHFNPGDDPSQASVGWVIRAVPGVATPVYHQSGDHPLWLVSTRDDIPQPGGFSHFHWVDGPMNAMNLEIGQSYEGYYFELTAKDTFAFKHGSDLDLVYVINGLDLATHTNLVTVFPGFTDGDTGSGGGTGGH